MKQLNLKNINSRTPYYVHEREDKQHEFYFWDDRQMFRNRLFVIWFNNYENKDNYCMKTAEGKIEGQDNFIALIAKKDNPHLAKSMAEFDETVEILFRT